MFFSSKESKVIVFIGFYTKEVGTDAFVGRLPNSFLRIEIGKRRLATVCSWMPVVNLYNSVQHFHVRLIAKRGIAAKSRGR